MKNQILKMLMILIYSLAFSITDALPNRSTSHNFYLYLNGKATDPKEFVHINNGRLTLVDHPSRSGNTTELQFYAYLKRDGEIVEVNAYAHHFAVQSIELSEILKSAKVGDDLIIEPARKTDMPGKKIINVSYSMLFPVINWFPFLNKGRGGC